jgi:hypothetical protein
MDAGAIEHKLNHQTMVQLTKFVDFMASQQPKLPTGGKNTSTTTTIAKTNSLS